MCGRYMLTAPPDQVRQLFAHVDEPDFPPRYNIAPTQPIGIVAEIEGRRRFVLVRWGLWPGWAKDPRTLPLLINARAETMAEKPAFRAATRHRRCLVPATGFYEWRRLADGGKQPYLVRPRSGLVGFAGLWETWSSADGSEIDTAAIVTRAANRSLAPIHERMPAVIAPEDFAAWLDTRRVDVREALTLVRPVPEDLFEAVPVATRVNSVAHDDDGLIEPLGAAATATATEPSATPPRAARPARSGKKDGGQLDLF